jgi:hypothetical protein
MRKTFIGGVAAVALAAVAGVAMAQSPTPQPGAERVRPLRGDADNDGRISQAEFVDGRLARLTAADSNGDGSVTHEELQAVMQVRRAERADKRFARLDTDGNGAITRAEFDAARSERGPRRDRARGGGRHHVMRVAHRGQRAERGPVVIADMRAKLTERFAKLDANSDGFVAPDEQRAARQAQREQRRERREARGTQQPASPAPASE